LIKQAFNKKIIGVSRFSQPGLEDELNQLGIETYNADLLEEEQLKSLPDISNVLYLAGTKFGTVGKESFTLGNECLLTVACCPKI
jgi:hypothetical protein